jgi:hypothetical protein
MPLVERVGWLGIVTVTVERGGRVVRRDQFRNLITDAGVDLLAAALLGIPATIGAVAVGTDDTAPAVGDVLLGAEAWRDAPVDAELTGPGTIHTRVYVPQAEANVAIRELGWFAGPAADPLVPDTGELIARVLYAHDKQADETLYIDRTDIIGRA